MADFILGGSKITADGDCSHEIKKDTPWKGSYDQSRQHIQKQRYYFAKRGQSSQGYGFFQWSCMDMRVGLRRKLSADELMLLNCGVGEDS